METTRPHGPVDGARASIRDDSPPLVVGPDHVSQYDDEADDRTLPPGVSGRLPRGWLPATTLAVGVIVGLVAAAWIGLGGGSNVLEDGSTETQENATPDSPATDADTNETDGAQAEGAGTETDLDGDGVLDVDDNCPDVANQDQLDTDGNTVGDGCDADDDNDTVPDDIDNCPAIINGTQADEDEDGIGDACDDFPDRDQDGIIDTEDSCIEEPEDADADGDGIVDKCDASPRGMVAVAASAQITRVSILNTDDEPDMFGDLSVAGTSVGLPEISDMREIRPDNWQSGRVAIQADSTQVQVRVSIRDEAGFCLFCSDELVDLNPEPGANALHVLIDTSTGTVDLASEDWAPLGNIGLLTGSEDGDLSGTITQQGDNNDIHLASIDMSLSLIREPAP